jgi:hypothetical protein
LALFSFRKSGDAKQPPSANPPATAGAPAGADGSGSQPPTGSAGGSGGADGFEPQPDKARKWFEFAQASAESYNYEAALHYFASGIRLDPALMSAHEAMFEAAIQYTNRGGKPATGKELKQVEGPHAVHKFAAAEFAWLKDFYNASLALRFLEAAAKAAQLEVGHWAAPKVFHVLGKQKKISKNALLQAKEVFAKVAAWDQAIAAGEAALRLDPADSKLQTELKDFVAQRAMDQAGYNESAGKEGGYRSFIKDSDKQRALADSEAITASSTVEERNFERALEEYEKAATNPDVIFKYAQLLKRRGSQEDELKARQVYLKGFQDTGEYRFRMSAGDIELEQARRRVAALKQTLDHAGNDLNLQVEYEQAIQQYQQLQIREFTERVEKYPTDRRMKIALGEAFYEQQRFGDAMPLFQSAKEEPRLRLRAGWMLGKCFASEEWHMEAESEFKEALAKMDASEREAENDIRYDLMVTLIARARGERAEAIAREALTICSDIARKDISYRDIRTRRREIDQLVKELTATGGSRSTGAPGSGSGGGSGPGGGAA